MRSRSSRRWRASWPLTCKALLLCLCLCLCLCPRAAEAVTLDSRAVLVATDRGPAGRNAATCDFIRTSLCYMGLEARFADFDEDVALDEYAYVLLALDEDAELSGWGLRLRESGCRVLVVGRGGLDGLTDDVTELGPSFVAGFPAGEETRRMLVRADTLRLSAYDKALDGTVRDDTGVYPLCAVQGRITHLAYLDAEDADMQAYFLTLVRKWMWPYDNLPTAYGGYVVLSEAYPFSDLAELQERTDLLLSAHIPFAVCVAPIYDHADYPSMKRFCEYLRYLQGAGVGLLMRTPYVQTVHMDVEEVNARIAAGYEAYRQYGVYPLGLCAPEMYWFTEEGLAVLRSTRIAFLFPTDETPDVSQLAKNPGYADGHILAVPAYGASGLITSALRQAVYVPLSVGMDELAAAIKGWRSSRVSLLSVRDLDCSLYLKGGAYIHREGTVLMDGDAPVSLAYEPFEYEERFEYGRGFTQFLTNQIGSFNQVILTLVFAVSAIFLLFLLAARKRIKSQILRRPGAGARGRKRVDR